jgi:RNA polymerase sigma factor (sigma-70 family)
VDMRTTTDDQSIDHEIGEAQLFWACWTAELPHFKKLCGRWLCASPQDVDDVLSLGALKALAYLRHHPGEVRRFRPWAQRLLHNLCVDLLRAQRRVIELVDDDPTSQAAGPVTSDPPQTRDLSRRELGRALDRALITLPPRLRDVFDLRFREELTYPEIAQRLQITQENARKRVQQAREQLRRQLLEHAH